MFEEKFFARKKINFSKLLKYGFTEDDGLYKYSTVVLDGDFCLRVFISADGAVSTRMIDSESGDEYTLYRVDPCVGEFVGKVREACEKVLTDISVQCCDSNVFRFEQTKEIIEYARKKYGDGPEFLWEKYSDSAVLRRKDTKKWYGAVLTVSRRKLGLDSDEVVEIIDLRIDPEATIKTVDNEKYFPGWHMNKKSWYTIILDGSVDTDELCRRIDESYILAVK